MRGCTQQKGGADFLTCTIQQCILALIVDTCREVRGKKAIGVSLGCSFIS